MFQIGFKWKRDEIFHKTHFQLESSYSTDCLLKIIKMGEKGDFKLLFFTSTDGIFILFQGRLQRGAVNKLKSLE